MRKIKAGAIIENVRLAKIGLMCIPDRPGIASADLTELGERGIDVEFIVQSIDLEDRPHMVLFVAQDDLEAALSLIGGAGPKVQAEELICQPGVAMVSLFGPDFREQPGIAGVAFSALASLGIDILAISTPICTLSCVIDSARVAEAKESLRKLLTCPRASSLLCRAGYGPAAVPAKGEAELWVRCSAYRWRRN